MVDEVARTAIVFDASGAKKGADEFAVAGEKVIATNNKVEQSVTRTGKAAKDAAAIQAAAAAAGGDAIATATNRIVVSADRQAAMLDRYAKHLDPMAAAVARYQRQVANLNDVVEQQGPHAVRAAELLVVAQQKLTTAQQAVGKATSDTGKTLDAHAKSSNAASFAMRDLGIQSIDVFSQMSSGAPIMTTLIQQGSQVAQVMAVSGVGFRALAAGVGNAFASVGRWVAANPLTVGLGLITAAIAGIAVAAESASRRFIDLTQQLRSVKGDYDTLATTIDKASKTAGGSTVLSTAQARTFQQSIVSDAPYSPQDAASLVQLTKLGADIMRAFNVDMATAAKRLTDALQSPAKAAQELADRQFPGMTAAIARHVLILEKQGNVAEAQKIVLDAYTKALNNASEAGTPVQKMLNDMAKGWDMLTTALGSFTNKAIGWLEEMRKSGSGLKNMTPPPTSTGQELVDAQAAALREAFPSLFRGGGTVLTDQTPGVPSNSIGHGVMQVVPGTAAARGLPEGFIDRNAGQNIIAGLGLLNDLFRQYGSDTRSITKAYGGFSDANTAGLDKRIAKQSAANVAGLPTDIAGGIKFIAGRFGWPDWLTQLALQMTVLESGGRQFTDSTGAAAAVAPVKEQFGPGAGPDAITAGRANDAVKQFGGTIPGQREELAATIQGLKQLREQLGANSIAGQQITTILGPLEGQLVNLRTATEQLNKSQRDQTAVSGIEEGAAKQLAVAYQQLDEARIADTGSAASAAEKAALRTEIMKQLGAEMQLLVDTTDRAIKDQDALTASYDMGYAAILRTTAGIKAMNDARKMFPAGPERDAAARIFAGQNVRTAAQGQEQVAKQSTITTNEALQVLAAEREGLSQTNNERTLNIAHLKAEQTAKRDLSLTSDVLRQKYVAEQDAIAETTYALNEQKHALDTVTGMFESSFDTIGNAITQALVNGQGAAVNFRNVMMSVAQQIMQQFLKLALVNPFLNLLNPSGNRDTLGSIFGALNTIPGSSTSDGGSSGATGIIGGIISIGAKIAGLFGGGPDFSAGATGKAGIAEAASAVAGTGSGASYGSNFSLNAMHSGGIVGSNDNYPMRSVPAQMIANAPRFHNGMPGLRPDELPAVLQRGERVLTRAQDDRIQSMVTAMTNELAGGMGGKEFRDIMQRGQQGFAQSGGKQEGDNVSISIDARHATPEAVNSFRRSMPQVASTMADQLRLAKARNR